jgi:isoleucyl-tRNA synthetase
VDAELVDAMAVTHQVIGLGRAARAQAGPPVSKLRQPLAAALVAAPATQREALRAHAAEIAAELNVKEVRVVDDVSSLVTIELVPNFRALGPRLGKAVPLVKQLLADGDYRVVDGVVRVGEWELRDGEYEERASPRPGLAVAHEGALAVGVETALADGLVEEGIARDLVHQLQAMRKDAGLEITDRIHVRWTGNERASRVVAAHADYVARETLALAIDRDDRLDGSAVAFATEGAEWRLAIAKA